MTRFTDKIDMRFQYVPASQTDIRKTFARIKRELREKAEAEARKPRATVKQIREAK